MKNKQYCWKIFLLLYCCLQMSMLSISSIISQLVEVYPTYDIFEIQFLTTFPDIVVVCASIICGQIMKNANKKHLVSISCIMFLVTALGGFLFHQSYLILIVWSGTLGLAIGILIPTAIAIINEKTTDSEKTKMIGLQNSAIGIGGIIVIAVAGLLASYKWYFSYLSFGLILPGFIGLMFTLKSKKTYHASICEKMVLNIPETMKYAIITFLFFSAYNAIPTNMSLYLYERGIEGSIPSSIAIGCMLLGSAIAGFFYEKIYNAIYEKTLLMGFVFLILGLIGICIVNKYILVLPMMMIAGGSLSLVMATTTSILLKGDARKNTSLAVAMVMAACDCGGFFSPVYTILSSFIFKNELTVFRFLLIIGLLVLLTITLMINNLYEKKVKLCD